jgi:NADH:ubiquinone oxidoreductase subunit 2 (subunit N)
MTIFLILIFLMSSDYFRAEKFQVTEYIIISLLAVLGMFLLVSSNDFVFFI